MINISSKDIFWSYISSIIKVLYPFTTFVFTLKYLNSTEIGFYSILISISSIGVILDFGFNQTFTRNLTYVFSGTEKILTNGFIKKSINISDINYKLLKALIFVVKNYYKKITLIYFSFVFLFGSIYIYYLTKNYNNEVNNLYLIWIIFLFTSSYTIYTSYYESLLISKGLIKKTRIIQIMGIGLNLFIFFILLKFNFGILSMIVSKFISDYFIRTLFKNYFYNKDLIEELNKIEYLSKFSILRLKRTLKENSFKSGMVIISSVILYKISILIASFYLDLHEIASFTISTQLSSFISTFSTIYFFSQQTSIVSNRIANNKLKIKFIYINSKIIFTLTFIIFSIFLFIFKNNILQFSNSRTEFISNTYFLFLLLFTYLETNQSIAGTILSSNNKIPYFKASIISGITGIFFLFFFFIIFKPSVLYLIIAPGFAHLYNNFKWPYEASKDLSVKYQDYFNLKYI